MRYFAYFCTRISNLIKVLNKGLYKRYLNTYLFRGQRYVLFSTFKTETQKKRYVHPDKNRNPTAYRHNRMARSKS